MFFVEHEITILKLMTFFVLFLFSNKIGMEGKPGRKSLGTKVTETWYRFLVETNL